MLENFYGSTDTGRLRDNNEDTFFVEKISNGQFIAACVIDGVGGYEGGEIAAGIARDNILEHLNKKAADVSKAMVEAIIAANAKIYHERSKSKEHQSMSCVLTLAVIDVKNNQFHYAHVGDTRLYLLRDNTLVKVTKDHSFVGFLEDSKRLTEDAAMKHPKRNEINKALGFDLNIENQADYIETGTSPFLPSDMLLLCSDGLTDLVNSESITNVLTSNNTVEEKTQTLIKAANDAGGKDNITVVIVHNDKKPVAMKATKPVLVKKKKVQGEQVQHVEEKAEAMSNVVQTKRSGTTAIVLLSLLCLLLAAGLVWLWMQRQPQEKDTPPVMVQNVRGAEEQKFIDHLERDSAGIVVFPDSLFQNGVTITDTIRILKDSAHINGNGITLRADSAYKGPAWVIAPHVKNLIIENINFENFNIGILTHNSKLTLRNVTFPNCKFSVLTPMVLQSDSITNTNFRDTITGRKFSLTNSND